MKKNLEVLDKIADRVLAYRPKNKKAKRRKKRASKRRKGSKDDDT